MKIINLDIDSFLSGDTKIEEIGLVFNPAVEVDWVYFNSSEQQFETYDDYPQSARDNACKVLRWIDEHGRDEVQGMTQTGLARANQLCSGEKISEETIARMSAFERHRKNSEISEEYKGTPWKDKGYVSWLGWGGTSGIEWAGRKLEQIRRERMNSQCGCPITSDFVESRQGISVGDYVSWTYAGRGSDSDRGRGQVKEIRVEGEVNIPDTDLTLTATEERPVALIETRDGKIVGQYIDGDMRVIQKPEDFNGLYDTREEAEEKAKQLGCTGSHPMGDKWMPCSSHSDLYNKDEEMINGIVELLLQVEDIENRAKMALQVLEDFKRDGVEVDFDLFLERIGLGGPDLSYLWDDTMELEDLLEQGYVISHVNEVDPSEVLNEYRQKFNKEGITEEQFYTLVSKPNEPSVLDSPFSIRRYVYSIGPAGGPDLIPTSREFCRRMMGKRQLVWRFEDINLLSTQLNSEDTDRRIIPRPKGARVNTWLYLGGANCRHRWMEIHLDPGERVRNNKQRALKDSKVTLDAPGQAGQVNEGVQYGRERDPQTLREESMSYDDSNILPYTKEVDDEVLLKDLPIGFLQGVPVYNTKEEAEGKSVSMGCEGVYEKVDYLGRESFRPCRTMKKNSFSTREEHFKLDDEKRMIYAPAMIPNKLIRRYEPGEGEYWVRFTKEAIERGAHKFLMEGRTTPEFVNYEHTDKKFDGIYLVESWIVGSEEDKIYDYGYTRDSVPEGSWVVGYKVDNDELWNDYVKKGLVKAVSVEGLFDMSFKSEKKDEYLLEEVINILNQID